MSIIMKTAKQWKEYYETQEFKDSYTYKGKDLGVTCTEEATRFCLWSPPAERVTLHLYRDGLSSPPFEKIPMQRGEQGVWSHTAKGSLHGIYYDYELVFDGEACVTADPYAKACGINGRRSMVVDLKKTDPAGWSEDKAKGPSTEHVIYELHVKEFSWDPSGGFPQEYRGKYKAFLCDNTTLHHDGIHPTGLSYLKELGVTHVQLMPVYDYGSVDEAGEDEQFNWGYDPVNYNVPEGSYATDAGHGEVRIRELKEMIQSLHRQGFGVIMDVVYNHTYSLDSPFQKTVPWYYYRTHQDGTLSNGSGCGNDVASERPMCARYILDSVLYWAQEYHIDGFRFDLMGLLDTELMNGIREKLDQSFGKGVKLMFGEPWAAGQTAMEERFFPALKEQIQSLDPHIGMFCDNTRDAIKGAVFEPDIPGFVNGGAGLENYILNSVKAWCGTSEIKVKAPSQIISYVSAHDNYTLWDKLCVTVADEELRRKAYRLAAGIYMNCQGSLFLLSGEEFARTKGGNGNSYRAPITVNCLDWEKAWQEEALVNYYKGLIALRKQLPGLCDKSREAPGRIKARWGREGVVCIEVDNRVRQDLDRWETLQLVFNSRQESVEIPLPAGMWEILADGGDSFLWKAPSCVSKGIKAAPVSIVILGKQTKK